MSTPTAAEREALELRARGQLPGDEDLAAVVLNLTPEQAGKAITTIAAFVKEKFPMLGGAVDQIFSTGNKEY